MQETFLQYLGQYKKFVSDELKTIQGDYLSILYTGEPREVSLSTFFEGCLERPINFESLAEFKQGVCCWSKRALKIGELV